MSVLRILRGLLVIGALIYALVCVWVYYYQRHLLYFPTHYSDAEGLPSWAYQGRILGSMREVQNPSSIWLMTHGNGGQSCLRGYVLSCLPRDASLYVVEYPGYGIREGHPDRRSIDLAVKEAYKALLERFPGKPIGVIGESIGSGPASVLAGEKVPPSKFVLIVPFDSLSSVAAEHIPFLPVRWLLKDRWNNVEALKNYRGPVEVYGAEFDEIIPVHHAMNLAKSIGAKFTLMQCGHNDWSSTGLVHLE
jgi:uncharacterized protein